MEPSNAVRGFKAVLSWSQDLFGVTQRLAALTFFIFVFCVDFLGVLEKASLVYKSFGSDIIRANRNS